MLAAGHAGLGPASGLAVHKPITQAQRSAETLFETKSVVEIREIEARTRQEIADKSTQLRQRVGDSHRDLIDGTEKIATISKNCGAVLSNVLAVQQALAALAAGLAGGGTDGGGEAVVRKHSDLHAVGGRVKYILDTTEVVWGSLDASQYTDAARRLLRAELVHAQLLGSFPPELLARFPLLGHQWPAVQKFRGQISEAARATLEGPRALQAGVAADALAALSALEGLDAAAALRQLLTARRAWVAGRLAAAAAAAAGEGDAATPEAAARALSELSQAVQTTVAQAVALFLPAPAGGPADGAAAATSASLTVLQRAAEEAASDASELYFGGAFGLGDGAAAPEAAAWVSRAAAALSALAPLPQAAVAAELRPWVEEVAQGFANAGLLLLGACGDAAALRAAERTVRSAIDAWTPEAPSAAAGGAGGAAPEAAAVPGRAWAVAAEAAMGSPLSVWQALLSEPFLERSKQLLSDSVQAALGSPIPALEAALSEAAAADPPMPVGAVRPPYWPACDAGAATAGALGRGGSLALGLGGGAAGSALWRPAASLARSLSSAGLAANGAGGFGEGGFRGCVPAILKTFDSLLLDALAAAQELMAPADAPERAGPAATAQPPPRPARIGGAAAAAATAPPLDAARAAALQPFVQERCLEAVLALASDLERRLPAAAAAPAVGPAGVAAVEQALLIGRLCSALAGASEALPAALGPPAVWHSKLAARAAAAAARGSAGAASSSPLAAAPIGSAQPPAPALARVAARLSAVAAAAYGAWASWAARSIASEAAAAYASDAALAATAPPLSWVETVVPVGAGGGFGLPSPGTEGGASALDDEMRFMLPAGPSPAMLSALMTACWETVRAGDHAVAPDALQLLAWELQGALAPILEAAADGPRGGGGGGSGDGINGAAGAGAAARGPASEKGVLQLLLDQRFARDVLAGAHPVDGGGDGSGGAVAAAVGARRQQLAALEQQLQERLDPIDWATYEPHLWANAAACYQRSHVLLGALAQLQRAYPDPPSTAGKAGAAAAAAAAPEMNPFGVLPVAPRFPYLPISTPSVAQHLAATRQRSLGPAGAAAAAVGPAPVAAIGGAAATAAGAASGAAAKSDLAAEYSLADFGASSSAYNSRAAAAAAAAAHHEQTAAAAGAFDAGGMAGLSAGAGAALGALQARLHGGVLSNAFTGMLGESGAAAAAARDIAQNIQNFGDLLPGGLMSTGLMSSFTKGGGSGSGKR